eukprot:scaffold15096_cov200-Alexandrium_tamarense.AAC.3
MTDEWTLANVGRNDDEEDDYGLGLGRLVTQPSLIRSVRAINIEEMRRLDDSDRNRVQQDIVAHLLRKHH